MWKSESPKTTTKPKPAVRPEPSAQPQLRKSVSEETIRIRARQKWEAAGKPNGDDLRFWLEAEQEILQSN
jgi:DUF2934 family protein